MSNIYLLATGSMGRKGMGLPGPSVNQSIKLLSFLFFTVRVKEFAKMITIFQSLL